MNPPYFCRLMMNKNFAAHVALASAAIIFGANYWVSKGLMPGYLSPEQLVFIRLAGAFVLFFVTAFFGGNEKVERKDLITIAIASLLGTTLNQYWFFIGLNYSTPVDIALIHVTNPIFVLIFAALMTQEKVTPLKITGILLGSAGSVIMIVYHGDITFDSDTFKGNIFALLNTLAYAVYLIMIKPVMNKYSSVAVMKWVFAFGVLFSVPISFQSLLSVSFDHFTGSAWSALIFVVVATTFLAYLFTIYALKRLEASVVSFYIYLQPLIAALITAWMGVQAFTISKIVAAIFIFTGVYLVSGKSAKKSEVPESSQQMP